MFRGVSKPSEPVALLLELFFLKRDLPFGESLRTTKKLLYRVEDPVLSSDIGIGKKVFQVGTPETDERWKGLVSGLFQKGPRFPRGRKKITLD